MKDYEKELKIQLAAHLSVPKNWIFTVWFSKTIQNAKGMFILDMPFDTFYYEVTLNGETNEVYIDVYEKQQHVVKKFSDTELKTELEEEDEK